MAFTPNYCTGNEHGVYSESGGGDGTGLYNSHAGNVAVVTTSPRNGAYCLEVGSAVTSANHRVDKTIVAGQKKLVRVGLWVDTLPSADAGVVAFDGSSYNLTIRLKTTGVLVAYNSTTANEVTGPTLSTGRWYLLEIQYDGSANPHTINWQVDMVQYGQQTWAGTAANTTSVRFGAAIARTGVCRYDDFIVGDFTSPSDWVGDGKVIKLIPASDGTHNIAVSEFFRGDGATSPVLSTDTNVWDQLDGVIPWTTTRETTDNISQQLTGTGNYLEVKNGATPEGGIANAVEALLEYSSTGTLANQGGCVVVNSGAVETTVWGNTSARADYSESTNFYKSALVTAPSAGWTKAEIDALKWRIGYSNDVSPIPTWQALMLEVDYPRKSLMPQPRQPNRNALLRR